MIMMVGTMRRMVVGTMRRVRRAKVVVPPRDS
jgi:hypothetical protein